MESFIRTDQFNFIKSQTKNLINGHSTAKDQGVIHALKELANERVTGLFAELNEEQRQLLEPIVHVEDRETADHYLAQVKPNVIPFQELTETMIKRLFPKVKKLKVPVLDELDFKKISYLGWNDGGSNKKFIITPINGKLVGIYGTFKSTHKKSICALCNGNEEVGLFTAELIRPGKDAYMTRGNYICHDSQTCNDNVIQLDKLHTFIALLTT